MGGKISNKRLDEVESAVSEHGYAGAAKILKIKPESIRRQHRMALERNREKAPDPIEGNEALARKILERYSASELRAIANGGIIKPSRRAVYDFSGDEVTIGFCTDTHIGESSFSDALWIAFLEECKTQGVDMIFHAGDVHEGMSNRPDQVYHLTDLGVSAQMDHAERLFRMTNIPIKAIDGNHDRWGIKSNGLFMVKDLAARMPDHVEFLGCDSGEVVINGTRWMLWHGEDGSSYATSYRIQKLIEAFTGGDKPNVLLCGHTHKQGFFFERNVHAVSGGALSYQSAWMKSTKKQCHTGFWIIRATIRKGQIVRFCPTWYPIYK